MVDLGIAKCKPNRRGCRGGLMNYRSAISFLPGGEPSLVTNVHQSSFNLNICAENRGPSRLHFVSSNKIPSTQTLNIPTCITDRRTNGFVGISQRSRRSENLTPVNVKKHPTLPKIVPRCLVINARSLAKPDAALALYTDLTSNNINI